MLEPMPNSSQDSRRPRFRTRVPPPEPSGAPAETVAHEPPFPGPPLLSLPVPAIRAPRDIGLLSKGLAYGSLIKPSPRSSQPRRIALGCERPAVSRARYKAPPPVQRGRQLFWKRLFCVVLAGGGLAAGYFWRNSPALDAPGGPPSPAREETRAASERLTSAFQAALDAAFGMMKGDQPQEARTRFGELLKQHPGWPQLQFEQARAAFYQRDNIGTKAILEDGLKNGRIAPADAEFMQAMLRVAAGNDAAAAQGFALAAAADPTGADTYYFWGECLRRLGKPAEAAQRFRSALLRNTHAALEGQYKVKLWFSEIEGNLAQASGSAALIDAELAQPHPGGYALAAAAARAIHDNKIMGAANFLRRAAETLDPPVFQVVLRDAIFVQESYRPELVEFFAPAPALRTR